MPPVARISAQEWNSMSSGTKSLLQRTADGKNPNIDFSFTSMRLPRGNLAHPPNTDRLEVRDSIAVQFTGASNGVDFAHLFTDGSYKTRPQMDQENRQRAQEAAQLKAQEDQFPKLSQTVARLAAWGDMERRIRALRDDRRMPVFTKQAEKANAMLAYQRFLQDQARARIAAAEAARNAERR